MKKYAVFISTVVALVLVAMVSACEKAISADDSKGATSNGNLRVSVYQIEQTPFESLFPDTKGAPRRAAAASRRATAASEVCTRLNFAVYDQDGTRLKMVSQTSNMADFGHVSFQLPEGTYRLVVVGHSASGNPTMTDLSKIQFTNTTGYSDTFLCCGLVTIGENPVDYEVTLDRIVSLCRFVITDDSYPADVKKMSFYYTGGSGAFDATTGLGSVNSKQEVKFDVATGQKQFDLYTFLHATEGTIHLTATALDAAGNELYTRQFDVPMQKNYITWLSGSFFDDSGSSSTSTITGVKVNTDWAGQSHLTF